MKTTIYILLSLILYSLPLFAQDAVDVVPQTATNPQVISGFNDEIRKTSRRLRMLEGGISLTTGVTGILPVTKGGTGQDFSAEAAQSLVFFDSTGHMDSIGIGTTGRFLMSNGALLPPSYEPIPDQDLIFISATTFTAENSKTITGLTPGTPYLLIVDLAEVAGNNELVFYPNGTLSTIECTAGYDSSGGTNKLMLHTGAGFGTSTGSWQIKFKTLQGDNTKTGVIMDGFDTGTDTRHSVYAILDSDADLSSVTIKGQAGTMTLTGTVYLYRYATS